MPLLTDRTVWESSSLPSSGEIGCWGCDAIADGSAGSTSPYRPPFDELSAPTRPRRWEELVLLTYSGGEGRRKAGNAEAARAVFNDRGGVLWWRSGSGISSCDSGAARTTSFGASLGAATFELARRRWLGLVTGAAMGKSVRGGLGCSYL
jgi:hypothetical protein